jgi:phosphopantetheinyl transferase
VETQLDNAAERAMMRSGVSRAPVNNGVLSGMDRVYLGFMEYSILDISSTNLALLDTDEQKRWQSYRGRNAGNAFLAGRILSKTMLSVLSQRPIGDIRFHLNDMGRPVYQGMEFSIAHSGGLAVCAASALMVGADIEYHDRTRDFMNITHEMFTDDEASKITRAGLETHSVFYNIWTAKEAWLKSRNLGVWDMAEAPSPSDVTSTELCDGFRLPLRSPYSVSIAIDGLINPDGLMIFDGFLPTSNLAPGLPVPLRYAPIHKV